MEGFYNHSIREYSLGFIRYKFYYSELEWFVRLDIGN